MKFDYVWIGSSGGISKTQSENYLICHLQLYQVKIYIVLRCFPSGCGFGHIFLHISWGKSDRGKRERNFPH